MPVMDGFECASLIREFEREQGRASVPIVAMTAFSTSEDQSKCIQMGMTDYIAKPFNQTQFHNIIFKYIPRPVT